ncbi:hypothetical protein BKA70DRAFT_598847 [Coprinopsis sp. MPI-PUGE-AT-0042]|nr:hypothetical protein BKA70DRAFT_598847 [Coprinopsis sp. MPI-PUGE-AT-0042]
MYDHQPTVPRTAQCGARCSARTAVEAGRRRSSLLPTPMALMGLSMSSSGSGRDGGTPLRPSWRRQRAGPLRAATDLPLGQLTKRPSLSWYNMGKDMEKSLENSHWDTRECTDLHNLLPALNASILTHFLKNKPDEPHEACWSTPMPSLLLLSHIPEATCIPKSPTFPSFSSRRL